MPNAFRADPETAAPFFAPSRVLAWSEINAMSPGPEPAVALWRPEGVHAAIGLSQDPETELNLDAMRRDGVGFVRRQSGGGAVLLYAGVLCWEAWASVESLGEFSGIRPAYAALSRPVVAALSGLGITAFRAGISDLSVLDPERGTVRKVAGTAQLRRREGVLVHGALLVHADVGRMTEYLNFPSASPEYRGNRRHRDFCVSLRELAGGGGPALMNGMIEGMEAAAKGAGWRIEAVPARVSAEVEKLMKEKYESNEWNYSKKRPG